MLAASLSGCLGDDDDCDDESLRQIRIVDNGDHVALQQVTSVPTLPASGGFGTHLADCGG